ncbi:CLCA_X family protein [Agarivorans sp. Z349TD_8]|uniref:CLCA_X family protein n=1 Tax=Agarivorans sp. Z349TD_8 TaxID=3421434 RepID=UPI003D7D1492
MDKSEPGQSGLYRDYYRRGPDYRHGDEVDFADIKNTFGFAGLSIGAWVTAQEKVLAANLLFDALADLAFLLNLPPQALGLRGHLNLAFGHGGQRLAQAHYALNSRTLALAKNAGAGALAHEWWHAFDHYMADKLFVEPAAIHDFASSRWLSDDRQRQHPLNQRLNRLFVVALLSSDGQDLNSYVRRSLALDRQFKQSYFSLPTEMMARAFEAWVQSREELKNAYLVSGTKQSELAQAGAYPDSEHLQRIGVALLAYFESLGQALTQTEL